MSNHQSDNRSEKSSAHEVIVNHIDLKKKTGDGPAKLSRKQLELMESKIAAHRGTYLKYLKDDLKQLFALLHASRQSNQLNDEAQATVYDISHRIRGEAAMNAQEAVGIIANLLCEFLETANTNTNKHLSFVELHVGAMNAIYDAHINGTEDAQIHEIIEGFKAARVKLSSKS